MVNLWYSRIVLLKVSTLADVSEHHHSAVASKLAENGYDGEGNPIEKQSE